MIFIIDKYPKMSIGHYWQMGFNFRKAFGALERQNTYLNPSARIAKDEDSGNLNSLSFSRYLEIVGDDNFFSECRRIITQFRNSNKDQKIEIIFPWLPQLSTLELKVFCDWAEELSATISGVTNLLPESASKFHVSKKYLYQDEFQESSSCNVLWIWADPSLSDSASTKLRRLPEYHPHSPRELIPNQNKVSLSFFGLLSPFRGLGEVFLIAIFNPRLILNIRGYGFSKMRIWRPFMNPKFRYISWREKPWVAIPAIFISLLMSTLRLLPNLRLNIEPFPNQEDLEKAISKSDAIFYAAKLPHSSGIVLTSLASGVPVIWMGNSGEASKVLLKAFPEGMITLQDILIPGRIFRKVRRLRTYSTRAVFSWQDFTDELQRFSAGEFS